jgi:hypothetical protein
MANFFAMSDDRLIGHGVRRERTRRDNGKNGRHRYNDFAHTSLLRPPKNHNNITLRRSRCKQWVVFGSKFTGDGACTLSSSPGFLRGNAAPASKPAAYVLGLP